MPIDSLGTKNRAPDHPLDQEPGSVTGECLVYGPISLTATSPTPVPLLTPRSVAV